MEQKEYEQIIQEWKDDNKELIKNGKCKKIFLENLPKHKNGINIGKIDWEKSIGYEIEFIYSTIKGVVKIINYSKNMLTIMYKNEVFILSTTQFSVCQLGKVLKTRTKEFKVEIGMIFKDDNRDITIIDRKIKPTEKIDKLGRKSILNEKWYKYKCNKCGFDCGEHYRDNEYRNELYVKEGNLLKGNGCSCCANQIVVQNINDIPTTANWMIPYFQGGYDEAKLYSKFSQKYLNFICPDCGTIKSKKFRIGRLFEEHSLGCPCCDNVSYSEKIMFSLLDKLKLNFEFHKNFSWSNRKEYDFYFEYDNEQYIVETHGLQHYQDAWDKLEKTQLNDRLKKELALANGIKSENYVVIDCRKSDLEWVKNSVFDSILNEMFDLSNANWNEFEEFALSNLVKIACEYKRNNPNLTTTEISKIMGISIGTIQRWLLKGFKIGWCEYDTKQEKIKSAKKLSKYINKTTLIFKNDTLLGVFESAKMISILSFKLFKIKLNEQLITRACRYKKQYKGFYFKHTSDLTIEELEKYKQQLKQS